MSLDWEQPELAPPVATLRISERQTHAMPMWLLPIELQDQIATQVAQDKPPARWIAFGAPDCPRPMAYMESRGWFEWHWQRGIDPDLKRRTLAPSIRSRVIARDGYVCGLCGWDVEPDDVHIDHVYPVSLGGTDDLDNLQVAHSSCNIRKGARI